jgi:hypothetical protein
MTDPESTDDHDLFLRISDEYSQASEAMKAIEKQAPLLIGLGHADQLDRFIADFIRMASAARENARESELPNFTEWYDEMLGKMRALRSSFDRPGGARDSDAP